MPCSRNRSRRLHQALGTHSILALLLLSFAGLAVPGFCLADSLKTYVTEFAVTGSPDKEELKTTLQGLLISRLGRERVQIVDTQAKSELVVAGSYTVFGKVFSLDALVKSTDSRMFVTLFEQGEGEDDVIPALGRLAKKIDAAIADYSPAPPPSSAPSATLPPAVVAAPATQLAGNVVAPKEGKGKSGWSTPPMEQVFVGISLGRKLPTGEREIFLAGEKVIRYCRLKGGDLIPVAEVLLQGASKILGIDSADLDGDGIPEIYVTVMDRETLSSRVYLPKEGGLEKIAGDLPYYFRGVALDGKSLRILTQEMGTTDDFFGGVAELVKVGSRFETRARRKLPRFGFLYNFNRFPDASGNTLYALLNPDGRLIVDAEDGKELWRSSDRFGGSENHFKRATMNERKYDFQYDRFVFLEQRIIVTPEGELLVPRNEGSYNAGNYRSYNKHAVYALRWNGAILQEKWHTPQSPTYLADYAYDPASRELFLLEVIGKDDLSGKGKTVVSVHPID